MASAVHRCGYGAHLWVPLGDFLGRGSPPGGFSVTVSSVGDGIGRPRLGPVASRGAGWCSPVKSAAELSLGDTVLLVDLCALVMPAFIQGVYYRRV